VLDGIGTQEGVPGAYMPGFAGMTDADIAALAHYVRRTRTDHPEWANLQAAVTKARKARRLTTAKQ
jgi:mono/diheme cytochrome c family protein